MENRRKTVLFYFFFIILTIFSLSAAFNEGFTRWVTGIPFFILFFVVIKIFHQSRKYKLWALGIIASSILINVTLPNNPFVYPILFNGYLMVKTDGYIHHYSDDSAGFYPVIHTGIGCTGCGKKIYHQVKQGEKIPVEAIVYTHPDFSLKRAYKTKYGNIVPDEHVQVSHEPCPLLMLGSLMYYPMLPILISTIWK